MPQFCNNIVIKVVIIITTILIHQHQPHTCQITWVTPGAYFIGKSEKKVQIETRHLSYRKNLKKNYVFYLVPR